MENITMNNTEQEEDMQIIPILRACWQEFFRHWMWFALSVALCLAAGYLYLQCQPRVYQRQSVMLIEDAGGSTGGGMSRGRRGNMNALLELNGISVGDNLANEIFILSSFRLMERVVDSLRLDVDYTISERLHEIALYRNRPFAVDFRTPFSDPATFKVRVNEDGTFSLHDFVVYTDEGKKESNEKITMRPGEVRNTPAGSVSIARDAAYDEFPKGNDVNVTRMSLKQAAAIYRSHVAASEYDKESSLITLVCNDVNPERAEDILNELFNAYKNDVVENKNRMANSTAHFIDDRIALIGQELSQVEDRMAQFKRSNQIIDFQQSAQVFANENSQARQQTLRLETQLAVARYLTEFLQDNSNDNEVIPMLSLPNAAFAGQITDYNTKMLERNRMRDNSNESSPVVRELDRQLLSLRGSIRSSLNSYVRSVELELRDARHNEAAITGKVSNVPEAEKQGLDIQRQQELKSTLYTYLLNKREEVALQMAINEANVRLVEDPMGSNIPVSPRRGIILLVSLFAGLLIPSLVIWLRHLLDVTITSRKEIEDSISVPIAGEIIRWDSSETGKLITEVDFAAPIVENFRVLRHKLDFMRHSAKVFVVTSSTPNQGKSFISTNLSAILGLADKHVLLIDADIRKRTLGRRFGVSPGLTAYLTDEENRLSLDDIVLKKAVSATVDFLPAGELPPNPAELLMSDKLDELIDRAKAKYDYVVIDTTPLLAVADANIINRVADLTLFVVRIGLQERAFLPELEKMYKTKQLRNLSIVVNDSVATHGYGYGYGYGSDGRRKKLKRTSSRGSGKWFGRS